MRASAVLLGTAIFLSAALVLSSNTAGADPSFSEFFDPSNINYPDIDIFGMLQSIFTDLSNFSSISSMSGFTGFLSDSASDISSGNFTIYSVVLIVCAVVMMLCVVSAVLGWRRGKKKLTEQEE